MSEVQSRPAPVRGRGGGGRGGRTSGRGGSGRGTNRSFSISGTNDAATHNEDDALPSLDDDGVAALNSKFGTYVPALREMFPSYTHVDLLYVLEECGGSPEDAAARLLEGRPVNTWGKVDPKKDRARSKAKDVSATTPDPTSSGPLRASRGGRGRSRTMTDRGARGGSGRGRPPQVPAPATNGSRAKDTTVLSIPTEESAEWDNNKTAFDQNGWGGDGGDSAAVSGHQALATPSQQVPAAHSHQSPAAAPIAPVANVPNKTSIIPEGTQKTWASMLRQSTAPKPAPLMPKEALTPADAIEPLPPAPEPAAVEAEVTPEEENTPQPGAATIAELATSNDPSTSITVMPEVVLPPSNDQLTETNLEQVLDESLPAPTLTVASEAADSYDSRFVSTTGTPLSAAHQQHQQQARAPPTSGFAASALKATERPAIRTPSFQQRRILDQQEPVRMPGNRDIERATVQFGSFSLADPADDDIDGDREELQTRTQLPPDSPLHPIRTSLPPAQPAPVPDAFPAQKVLTPIANPLAPSTIPAVVAPPSAPSAPSAAIAPPAPSALSAPPQPIASTTAVPAPPSSQQPQQQHLPQQPLQQQQPQQTTQPQFGRFGQPVPHEASSFGAPKPFETFGQQQQPQQAVAAAHAQYDAPGFPGQQPTSQPQTQQHQPSGNFSSAPGDYPSYYTADAPNRAGYNYYNQSYGHQQGIGAQSQNEGLQAQQHRSFGGFNASQNDNLSQYPQSAAQNPVQSRFGSQAVGEQMSGTTTPNPTVSQTQQQQQQQQTAQTGQGPSHNQPQDYAYGNHPYYNNAYYAAYANNYGGYNGYGAPHYGKGGLGYGQPNQYGMNPPQGPQGYGSSPAGGFGQAGLHRGEQTGSGGLSEFGRAASGQSAAQQQGGIGHSFGSMHDSFGRGGVGASSYSSQAGSQAFGTGPGGQPGIGAGPGGVADDLKPFGDAKGGAGGPSPSLGNASVRPGSAVNVGTPSQTSGLPPQANLGQQQSGGLGGMGAYGGYPGAHLQQQQQQQQQQPQPGGLHSNQSGGGYGGQQSNYYGSSNYYQNPGRGGGGGWGSNYGGSTFH